MGDLLMSTPAIRALKTSFRCHITVLTSTAATAVAAFIPEIDEVISADLPWVKPERGGDDKSFEELVEKIRAKQFDAAVIFTVYSQNPLPSAMLAYLAGIPKRLAYCRENPYALLTHWVPDKEPYDMIFHQVRRDLRLVNSIAAVTANERLSLQCNSRKWKDVKTQSHDKGIDLDRPWMILHAGVSEKKREFPATEWITAGRRIIDELKHQVILTGSGAEQKHIASLKDEIGEGAFSLAGLLDLESFILLVSKAPLIVSVNSGPIHIAAATGTPVLVLYALTNPQHLPWKVPGKALYFDVPESLRSKNEVIRYVHDYLFYRIKSQVTAEDVFEEVKDILVNDAAEVFPELVPLRSYSDNKETVSFNTRS